MRVAVLTENNSHNSEMSYLLSRIIFRILAVLFLIFLTSALSLARDLEEKKNSTDEPRITFTETEYDFGTINFGGEAVHYFVFFNTGKIPLVILNVRTSCGCAAPSWPKLPVGTGVKDSLRVEYNTKIRGTFNKSITVQSNSENAMVELRIKGNVIKVK